MFCVLHLAHLELLGGFEGLFEFVAEVIKAEVIFNDVVEL